jgi:hypothetical protein
MFTCPAAALCAAKAASAIAEYMSVNIFLAPPI